jgi:large subunit ribosomal protein L23
MELSNVIKGHIVTEKAERQKTSARTYTLVIDQGATKIDVKKALKKFYDVEVESVRVHLVRPKTRTFGTKGAQMEKRHRSKRAMVTLSTKSKTLDLSTLKTA